MGRAKDRALGREKDRTLGKEKDRILEKEKDRVLKKKVPVQIETASHPFEIRSFLTPLSCDLASSSFG